MAAFRFAMPPSTRDGSAELTKPRGLGIQPVMSVRFILGRAGSGKTHHCLASIRSQLARDAVDGPPLIFLVPEQASFQAERAIVEVTGDGGLGATGGLPASAEPSANTASQAARGTRKVSRDAALASHRAEVLSFQRLAFRVLDSVGAAPRIALTDTARVMVLRHLIAREAPNLQYYRRVERVAGSGSRSGSRSGLGWIERISATIAELIQEAVTPDALAKIVDDDSSDCAPATKLKLGDIRIIYQAYLDYLGEDRVDPSQYLAVARAYLSGCDWLVGAHLWVDGFASMSEQEVLTLLALAQKCAEVEITVLVDPGVVDRATTTPSKRLFSRIEETYRSLRGRLAEVGLIAETPVVLDPAEMPRFRGCGELAALEERLFGRGEGAIEGARSGSGGVEIVELPSRRVEVDYAVSRVCEWVFEGESPLRYRDIAMIVRDLDPYHDLLSDALRARGIPFFIDRRCPLSHHPIVELVRGLVALGSWSGSGGFSLESVRMLLKTELLPIGRDDADALENYLIAYGLEGIEAWGGGDWEKRMPDTRPPRGEAVDVSACPRLRRVNQTRRAVLSALEVWVGVSMNGESRTGGEWAEAIRAALTQVGAGATLADWARNAEEMGELVEAQEHRQVWGDLSGFLDDLAFAFDGVALGVEELGDVLESGLSVLSAGLVPPSVDQVLVGSIERSRHPDIKAAVVLGFNDGVFPAKLGEDSILNDDDREALRDGGIAVSAPARDRVFEESLLVYIAMTRASRRLSITYTKTDDSGKAMRASPYVEVLTEALGGTAVKEVLDPARSREVWDIHCTGDLRRRLAAEFRERNSAGEDAGNERARWNTIYDRCRTLLSSDGLTRIAARSLGDTKSPELSDATVAALYRHPLRTSVSQLEAYASCPFKHFSKYSLGLKDRTEATLEVTDVGTVHHAILERVVDTLREQKCAMGDWSEQELDDAVASACVAVVEHGGLTETSSYARDEYILRRSAERISRVMRFSRKASLAGRAKPAAAELAYGFDEDDGLPALTIVTPRGRKVQLRGYIDRVDVAEIGDELLGIVIDYKRTRDKRLDLSEVYHGLSLQLPAYLLALAGAKRTPAGRPIRPIGALYVSLATKYCKVGHPSEADEQSEEKRHGLSKPRGLLLADNLDVLDSTSKGWSEFHNVFVNKDGTPGRVGSSDVVDADAFAATLEHTKRELGKLADAMLDGCVAVAPFRLGNKGPCDWCEMRDVCRHEQVTSRTRFLEKLKRAEVLTRMVEGVR